MSRILIVDDEASICYAFREFLTDEGHHVVVAASAEEGLDLAERARPDAVVLDVRLPGMDGLSAIPRFRSLIGNAPIVVMTAFGNLDTAVRAIESGAFDYLVKPFDLDQAATVLSRALKAPRERPIAAHGDEGPDGLLVGSSPAMQDLFKRIALVAPTDVPVLITGESGTGKELVARAIHRHSHRRSGPFLPVCLAALSPGLVEGELFGHVRGSFTGASHDRKGLLELAAGGTVLLDEIGDAAPGLQVKLLRAIEHREVTPVGDARPRPTDIRVLAATNRPLAELMATGAFREDLFFRLSVFRLHLPPLRERREDIPALAEHFLRQSRHPDAARFHLDESALSALQQRDWPGNVRELRNAVEHAAIVARGHTILPEHLPPPADSAQVVPSSESRIATWLQEWASAEAAQGREDPDQAGLYDRFLEMAEPPILRAVLEECGGNRLLAARILGIHRTTLRQKLQRYSLP
jgi:DNA-binding NtrC family response regulator